MAFLWFELKSTSVDFFIIFNGYILRKFKNRSIFGETEDFVTSGSEGAW